MDRNIFETLCSKIVPKLTDLSMLNLEGNRIESIQPIMGRMKSSTTFLPFKSLRSVDLSGNPIMKKMKEDPKEKVAILSLLKSYNTIHSLGCGDFDANYDSDIEYVLRINHAGRCIVECSNRKEDHRPLLPLSLWPIVLERVYKKSGHIYPRGSTRRKTNNVTGLNYLVREVGPALISHSMVENGGGKENDDDDDDDNKNENESDNDIEEGEDNSSVLTVPSLKGGERKRKRNVLVETK
jgi:hypothetical protein